MSGNEEYIFASGESIGGGVAEPPAVQNIWKDAIPDDAAAAGGGRIELSGDYLYLSSQRHGGQAGLTIYDISDPANPQRVIDNWKPDSMATAYSLQIIPGKEEYLAVADNNNNIFYIFDVSNPSSPQVVTEMPMPNSTFPCFGIANDILLGFVSFSAYQIFDLSDYTNPTFVRSVGNTITGYVEGNNTIAQGNYVWKFLDHFEMGVGSEYMCFHVGGIDSVTALGHQYPPPQIAWMGGNALKAIDTDTGMAAISLSTEPPSGLGKIMLVQLGI